MFVRVPRQRLSASNFEMVRELESAGLRPRITEAWRSAAEQEAAYKSGKSQVLYGFHNVTMADGDKVALAVDIVDDDNPQTTGTAFMLRLAAAAERNQLITRIRWGLTDDKIRTLDAAIAAGNWNAPVHVGWDSLHVEITGLTTAEARAGKRPLGGAARRLTARQAPGSLIRGMPRVGNDRCARTRWRSWEQIALSNMNWGIRCGLWRCCRFRTFHSGGEGPRRAPTIAARPARRCCCGPTRKPR